MPCYRLLALDIDGTLVGAGGEISPATRAAVARVQKAGVRVVLVTGRRYSRTLPFVAELGLDPQTPLVTATGALVKRPADHATLFRAEFLSETLPRLVREVDAAGFDPVLYADTFAAGFDFYVPRQQARQLELAEYLQFNSGSQRLLPDLVREPPPDCFAGFAMGSHEQMLQLETRLRANLPGQLDMHVLRSPRYVGFMCEIAPAGVNKWTGVARLADEWGIAPAEICAVGDDVNDVPMLRGAGLGVAMSNGTAPARAAADRVAPAQEDDGLAVVVDWVLQ